MRIYTMKLKLVILNEQEIKMHPSRIENQIYSSQVNCFTNQASSVMIITK